MKAVAQYPDAWTIGSVTRALRGTSVSLYANCAAAAVALDRFTTFRRHFAAAGYPVTAGRTLVVTRLRLWSNTAATLLRLGYGTTDVGGDAAAAPAGALYVDADFGLNRRLPFVVVTANVPTEYDVYWEIPAGGYCFLNPANVGAVVLAELAGVEV